MDLTEFLMARISEDERMARAARDRLPLIYDTAVLRDKGLGVAQAGHIARWDPARVLAECESKRRIVQEYAHERDTDHHWEQRDIGYEEGLEQAVRLLALPYVDHPDFDESWRP